MTILLITPDFASHYLPLVAIGQAWQENGEHVVVATGQYLRNLVRRDGFDYVELQLGEDGNDGLIRIHDRCASEFKANLEAAKHGMIAMLTFQAQRRQRDFFWQPEWVIDQLNRIYNDLHPNIIISVALGYNATAALLALNLRFVSFVTGHPSEFPAEGELYGFPYVFPKFVVPTESELTNLAELCLTMQQEFTETFNRFIQKYNPRSRKVVNALGVGSSDLIILNYPEELGTARDRPLPPCTAFVGSCVRSEKLDRELLHWFTTVEPDLPTIYVSLGSFFSIRTDVLARVIDAFRNEPVRLVLAYGVSNPMCLGSLPPHWIARRYFPQVAILPFCDLTVCHGGHNTLMESLTYGVPLLVGPFSSDQFGSAADVETFGLGAVFDPNRSTAQEIRELASVARSSQPRVAELGERLRNQSGAKEVLTLCSKMIMKQ